MIKVAGRPCTKEGVGAETAGSSNRSGDEIDMEAGVRSCAVTIAKTMHLAVLLALSFLTAGDCDLLRDSVHVTSAAARPNNDLWCYKCRAEEADDRCADLRHNNSTLVQKCHYERRMCMVKRFAYTTSNENSTTALKMWALERTCAKHCEPGCIVIGERTKLYACTSCCTTSLCNYGSGTEKQTFHLIISASIFLLTLFICN